MNKNIQQLALGSIFALACTLNLNAQVVSQKVGTNPTIITPSTAFEVESTNKGVLLPRVALTSATDATTILAPTTSMLVYNTATAGTSPNNVSPGYYYWTGTAWTRLTNGTSSAGADWTLTGNAGTTAGTNFIGTTDAIDFVTRTNNTERMRINTNGRVGIGVVPNDGSEARLQVNSNYSKTDVTRRNLAILGSNDATNAIGLYFQQGGGASTVNRYMSIDAVESGVSSIPLVLQNNGRVGIGVTAPLVKLQVNSNGDGMMLNTSDYVSGTTGSGVQIYHGAGTGNTHSRINAYTSGGSLAGNLVLNENGGNVGINTTTPSTKLHVNSATAGAIRIVDGTQGVGKVLTSEANGVGTWDFPKNKIYSGVTSTSFIAHGPATNTYLNTYIDLPPGKYIIQIGLLINNNAAALKTNAFYSPRLTLSTSSTSIQQTNITFLGSSLILSPTHTGATVGGYLTFCNGAILAEISGASTVRLYLFSTTPTAIGTGATTSDFSSGNNGENFIYAIPAI